MKFFTGSHHSLSLWERVGVRAILLVLLPMLALAQSQLTSAAIDSAVAGSLEIKLLELDTDLADIEVTQTNFLHALIPRVSVSARVGQSSVLLLDPTHPWSFPSDAFSAVVSLDLDRIVNTIPHQQAIIRAEQLRITVQRRRNELRHELISLTTQLEVLDSLIASLQVKRIYREKLVESAGIRYNAAKISFEELVRAKLDLADTHLDISTQKLKQSDLQSRLSALLNSSALAVHKERRAIP